MRSLSSSVVRWPEAVCVDDAVRRWAAEVVANHACVLGIGYFGSYARGDWGVGSDVDLVMVVENDDAPFARRAARVGRHRAPRARGPLGVHSGGMGEAPRRSLLPDLAEGDRVGLRAAGFRPEALGGVGSRGKDPAAARLVRR